MTKKNLALLVRHLSYRDVETPGEPESVPTTSAMASVLGVTRQCFNRWRRRWLPAPQPESNGSWNIAKVMEWATRHNLGTDDSEPDGEMKELLAERLRIDNDIRRLKHAKIESELLPIDIETAAIAAGIIHARNELLPISQKAIELVGLSAPEMEKKVRAWIVGALKAISAGPTPEMRERVNQAVAEAMEGAMAESGLLEKEAPKPKDAGGS